MMLISLSKGYEAMIDDEDYEKVTKYKWSVFNVSTNKTIYAVHSFEINGKRRLVGLHNFIMSPPKGFTVDHIDRNGLNCQRFNMRFATKSQQVINRSTSRNGYRGVIFKANGWQTSIGLNGKLYYGGRYKNEIDAAKAYDSLAIKYHGHFAILNFPED